ncbi:MAG: hypothetical protein KGL54_07065 [Sphingomonadales bacterium]|nr:hypothetical protein [Sphingomonadales bacterium]
MSPVEEELAAARAARDAARAALEDRAVTLRDALSGRSLTGRLREEAATRFKGAADETLEVADQSRPVIVATLAALLAWLFRRPLLAGARAVLTRLRRGEPRGAWQRLREWTARKAKS